MGYKMKGFSGFGNSPAKQTDNKEKPATTNKKQKYDPSTDSYAQAQKEYEESRNKDNKKDSTKKDDKGEKDTSVRKNVAKAVAGFIASEKRRQARKDEGAQRAADGIGRAMSRKL